MSRSPIFYLLMSIFCQVLGFGVALFFAQFGALPWALVVSMHALSASFSAKLLKLPIAWILMNCLLWPSILLFQNLEFSPNLLLILMAIGFLIYLPTFWTRVPFYPTSNLMYQVIEQQLPKNRPFRFVDLGCGYGSLLLFLAKQHPQASFEGIELAPLPAILARLRSIVGGVANLKIKWGSFWKVDFSSYDIVYAFLAPDPMPKLWQKVCAEMKAGVFLVNSFPINQKAQQVIEVQDQRACKLFVYKMPSK